MARIEGPKQRALSQLSNKSLEAVTAPVVAEPIKKTSGLAGASELIGLKPKLQNLTGGHRAFIPTTKPTAEMMAQVEAGMRGNAGTMPSTLQLKGGATETAATKEARPRSADAIAKSMEGLSRSDAGEQIANLSKPERKALLDAVERGTVTNGPIVAAVLTTHQAKAQVALLQKLPPKALEGLKEVWRKGEIDSYPNVKTAVGIEIAARTDWGKDKANAGAIAALRKAHGGDKIKAGLDPDGPASATTVNGKITVKDTLLQSPEATAAVLAHEGVHLHQGTNCCGGEGASSVQGEVEGNVAGIAVWDQLGKKNGDAAGLARDTLNSGSDRLKNGRLPAVTKWVTEGYLNHAKDMVAERTTNPSTKKGDTLADWQAHAKKYEDALAKLSPPRAASADTAKGVAAGGLKKKD